MATCRIGAGTFRASKRARELVNQVLDSGRISYGPLSQEFEQRLAGLHGCRYGVLSNSGTSSLQAALQALKELHGWQDGDEVIVPALTFVATVNVVLHNRLRPVLVDVEPDYYGIDPAMIKAARTERTRAIIPVHPFGQPCDMWAVSEQADGLCSIEDSCEAMFVTQNGWPIGWFSDVACFSTYVAHLLTTGVGGLAATNNPDYARLMRSLVNHGMSYDDLSGGDVFNPAKTRRDFVFERVGHSFRVTELEAALGLAQLETWEEMIQARQDNAAYLSAGLAGLEERLRLPRTRPGTGHSWMMYPIVCRQEGQRDRLMDFLEERGIASRRMLPLVTQPVYKDWLNPEDYPVAWRIDRNGFYVGCHQDLSWEELDYIIHTFGEFYGR